MNKNSDAFRKILITLIILLVVALAAAGLIGSLANRAAVAPAFSADLESLESARFLPAGNGFCALGEVTARLFGADGQTLATAAHSYVSPQGSGSRGHAAVWESGNENLLLMHEDGTAKNVSLSSGIISADINSQGWTAVLTEEKGYKGSAGVLREDGSMIFRVYIGSGYPVDALLSDDGSRLYLLLLTKDGSAVSVYNVGDDMEKNRWNGTNDELGIDLCRLSDGRIVVVTGTEMIFLSENAKELGRFSFEDRYLKDYSPEGSGFLAVLLGEYKTGSSETLFLTDTNGSVLINRTIGADISCLHCCRDRIAVCESETVRIYDRDLNVIGTKDGLAAIRAAFVREDGAALIFAGGTAAVYEP